MEGTPRSPQNSVTRSKGWQWPLLGTGGILMAQAHALWPIRDVVSHQSADYFYLDFPLLHLILTPFCSLADYLTTLSLNQLKILMAWTVLLMIISLGRRVWIGLLVLLSFLAWGALLPRPQARLVSLDPEVCLVDFHSHTRYSHDGRKSFTPEANMQWHRNQGYHAAFITDHNRTEASAEAYHLSGTDWRQTGYRGLRGEEISLYKTHLVLLGNPARVDNQPYDSDPAKVSLFISDMRKKGYLVVASLPEYWLYHWGEGVQSLVNAGIHGFEIVNSAPKALDFPRSLQLEVIALCRLNNLFMTGISDSHGYGSTTTAWNAVRLPGWEQMGPEKLESALLRHLPSAGFNAVQVLERTRSAPRSGAGLVIDPALNAGTYFRQLSLKQALIWIAWLWLGFGAWRLRKIHLI